MAKELRRIASCSLSSRGFIYGCFFLFHVYDVAAVSGTYLTSRCQAPLGRAFAVWQYSRAKFTNFPGVPNHCFLSVFPAVATLSRATVRQDARKRTCANSHPTFPTRMACPHPPKCIANVAVEATFNANLGVMQHFVNTIIRPLH